MKSVGGGTRVEPFVASLLGYTCSLMLALINSRWDFHKCKVDESFWVNAFAASIYTVYLGMFLRYAHHPVRLTTLRVWAPAAAGYLGVTAIVGILDESTVGLKWLCMIAGVASSGTPLVLLYFVMDRSLENLPDWFSSSAGLLHYTVWIIRAFPEPDPYDIVQNIAGAASALAFLVLLFKWKKQNEQRGDEYEHLLRDQIKIKVEDLQFGNKQAHDGANGLRTANNTEAELQEEKRAATAPPTPDKAAIHKRSASA